MAVEVKRKQRESTSAMLRRFARKVQLSGVLLSARKARFQKEKKSNLNAQFISNFKLRFYTVLT
ncbi:unnamed protein product [marine sediment metagenome]|uniref:30S ribosomal protein S21 n=1 Tax=marine sediment metagenome TaxID=412755 RepID=X1S2U1_9ZZZZ